MLSCVRRSFLCFKKMAGPFDSVYRKPEDYLPHSLSHWKNKRLSDIMIVMWKIMDWRKLYESFLGILLIILAFFGGMGCRMFLLRRQFEKEFASNPRLKVLAVRTLVERYQRPSEAKFNKSIAKLGEPTKSAMVKTRK